MADRERSDIDISHIRASGMAGLGLVVMVAVVAYAVPALRWVALVGLAGGIIGGVAVVMYRRKSSRGQLSKRSKIQGLGLDTRRP
jgi:hypothetical protein